MKSARYRYWLVFSGFSATFLISMPTWGADASKWEAPEQWFIYMVIFIVLIGSLLVLLFIRAALSGSSWSLEDALSEEAEITAMETDPSGNKTGKPLMDDTGKPLMITEMRASTSRMIAMLGMIIILLMFLGFGSFALFSFAKTGNMPDSIDKVVNFLLAGLALFAPYIVNKFSSMFESLSPK
jgi:uncharacterized membrane protein